MEKLYENIVKKLINKKEKISCMESCTGGLIASLITNIDGSSNIFDLGIVSYSNQEKIKFGVNKNILDEYTVYSIEVAKEMAKSISNLSNSNWGIGITGQLGKKDLSNNSENLNKVYISIFNKNNNKYFNYTIEPEGTNKYEKKISVAKYIQKELNYLI